MKGNGKERRRAVPCSQRILFLGSGSELGTGLASVVDFERISTTLPI